MVAVRSEVSEFDDIRFGAAGFATGALADIDDGSAPIELAVMESAAVGLVPMSLSFMVFTA